LSTLTTLDSGIIDYIISVFMSIDLPFDSLSTGVFSAHALDISLKIPFKLTFLQFITNFSLTI